MKAKRKPLETLTPETLGVEVEPRLITVKVREPPQRKGGEIVVDAAQLVQKLRDEAKVI
jgi:electron transfer flavoprotein beta subunit